MDGTFSAVLLPPIPLEFQRKSEEELTAPTPHCYFCGSEYEINANRKLPRSCKCSAHNCDG